MPKTRSTVGSLLALAAVVALVLVACRVTGPAGPPDAAVVLPVFDPAALADGRPPELGPLPPLHVRDYAPEGVDDGGRVRVRFNQPVVDMRKRAGQRSEIALELRALAGTSPVAGSGQVIPADSEWTHADTLELRPKDVLPMATAFEVTLPAGLTNRDGSSLDALRWRFETPRPTVQLLAEDQPLLGTDPIYLVTDQPMTAQALQEHVQVMVTSRSGAAPTTAAVRVEAVEVDALPELWSGYVDWYDADESWVWAVEPRRRWPRDVMLTVRVDENLRGQRGPLPLAEPFEIDVPVVDRLRVLGAQCAYRRGNGCESGPIGIELSTELAYGEPSVSVSPEPADLDIITYELAHDESLEDYYFGDDDDDDVHEHEERARPRHTVIEVDGEFTPGRSYVFTVAGSQVDLHGQRLGRAWRKRFVFSRPTPIKEQPGMADVRLWSRRGTFLRPEDARVGLITEHVEQARIKVVVLDDATRRRLLATRDLEDVPWPEGQTSVVLRTTDNRGEAGRSESTLDLSRFASQGDAVLVQLEALTLTDKARNEEPVAAARGLFQLSDIGIITSISPARGIIRAARASTGQPWPGLRARLIMGKDARALPSSDDDGLVRTPGAETMEDDAWVVLEAADGTDRVAMLLRPFGWPSWQGSTRSVAWSRGRYRPYARPTDEQQAERPSALRKGERALVGVQLGRGLYLPGDTVHLAGWSSISTPYGELATRRAPAGTPVVVELHRGDEVLASRRVKLDRHGRFASSLPLPPGASLGRYHAEARVLEATDSMGFSVADARIPTFEVEARTVPRSVLRGDSTSLRVSTRYLSGEPAPMERMHWQMSCYDSDFRPPGYDWRWSFTPSIHVPGVSDRGTVELQSAPTAKTRVALPTDIDAFAPLLRYTCSVSVAAQDASLQQSGADGRFEIHPAPVYVGTSVPRDPTEGDEYAVQVVVVDHGGQRVGLDGVELVVHHEPPLDEREAPTGKAPVEIERCRLDVPAEGDTARCVLPRLVVGRYTIRADAIVDGAPIRSDNEFEAVPRPPPEPEQTSAKSAPSSPWTPPKRLTIEGPQHAVPADEPIDVRIEGLDAGHGVLTISQTGLRRTTPFVLEGGQAVVKVTPRSGRGRMLELRAIVPRPEDGRTLPAVRQAYYDVEVTEDRSLTVGVDVAESARPGRTVPLTITVRDRAEQPVDARVAVWVVDEGIHQLRRPASAPLGWLFNPARTGLEQHTRSYDELLAPFVPWSLGRRGKRVPHVRQAKGQVKGNLEVEVRERFESVPLFVGNVGTGPDGVVELTLPLPDNLTRFEVAAVASAEMPASAGKRSGPARFGRGVATIAVSTPLVVRAALPRVLRPGDRARLAALITPPEGRRGTLVVDAKMVGAHASEALRFIGPVSVRRDVEGPARVEFEVEAKRAGTPRIRMAARFEPARGQPLASAVERPLPITVERTQIERVAVYGRLDRDEPVKIPVLVPPDVRPDVGGLTLTMRGTAIGDLDEAVHYLEEYPYGCLEQTSSRLLPLVALAGLSDRFTGDQARARQKRWVEGLDHLLSMQLDDGSFSYWPGGRTRAHYAGAYATWVMQLAAEGGQPVPERVLEQALSAVERSLARPAPQTGWKRLKWRAERALVVHVLAQAGRGGVEGMTEALDDLFDHRAELPLFARAELLMALHAVDPVDERIADVRRTISAQIEELPGQAHPIDRPSGGRYDELFDSPARDHALVLMAWLKLEPDAPLGDKLARGLRLRRVAGRWRNTQENAYALLALSAYARQREAEVVDHRIDAWVGPRSLGAVRQEGRDDAARALHVSMGELLGPLGADRIAPVVLDREGTGAAHYRLGMEWATHAEAPARRQGLGMTRRLLADDKEVSSVQAGRRYLLEIVLETDTRHRYLAAEIPLPAGLEAIDTRLGAGAAARAGELQWRGGWVSHEQLFGDRVLLFADDLPPGRHVHRIPVLASTPGEYRMPAAVVEGMYTPEVRARTEGTHLRVEPTDGD